MAMLKRSIMGSGTLHVAVIAAASLAWPHTLDFSDEPSPVLPVELVTVAEISNIAPTVAEPPKPEAPPPPQQQVQAPEPPPPPAEVAPAEPKEKPLPPPKETPKTAAAPPPPPLPRRKPAPQPQQQFNVDSVLALLDKRTPAKPSPQVDARLAERTIQGLGAQNAMAIDLKDALLAQMRECWNVPVGAPNPEQLIVQVRVFLAQDGSLAQPPQLEPQTRAAAAANAYMRTAAEAALRAVNVCEPYKQLPVDKYDAWREIVMTFDPSRMAGR
jgi:hypothetical protein